MLRSGSHSIPKTYLKTEGRRDAPVPSVQGRQTGVGAAGVALGIDVANFGGDKGMILLPTPHLEKMVLDD